MEKLSQICNKYEIYDYQLDIEVCFDRCMNQTTPIIN